jgi:hypothetical protein
LSGQFITAALRPGQRPTGAENAAIVQRVLKRLRAAWHETRCALALQHHPAEPSATRTDHDLEYAAQTWPKAFRGVLKAAVMALGDNPRFVITSLDLPSPEGLYRDLYCARGQDENWIKMIKNDRACDRTSDHRFLAHPCACSSPAPPTGSTTPSGPRYWCLPNWRRPSRSRSS